MVLKNTKSKPVKMESVSTEFLVQTLTSIQTSLITIAKEADANTEALGAVLENINSMADTMKIFHDQNGKDASKIIELDSEIRALRTETRLMNNDADIKEMKAKLQKIADDILEMKTVKTTKEEIQNVVTDEGPKKWNILNFLKDLAVGLSNVKTILIIIAVIILFVSSLIYGPSVIQTFIDILKKMTL